MGMKKTRIGLLLLLSALVAGLLVFLLGRYSVHVPAANLLSIEGVLIDPGHGGFDVGAIGVNGSHEDKLNLAFSKALQEALIERGIPAMLLRPDDNALGETKEEDMQTRADAIKNSKAAALVSIHMNSFPDDPEVFGPQVFFQRSSRQGETFAEALQPYLNDVSGGRRKPNSQGLMVLRAAEGVLPGVLVECGFLSNEKEAAMLSDPAYQKAFTEALAEGIMAYFGG